MQNYALQPLVLAFVSVRAARDICPRMCIRHNFFCIVFSENFNILSALSAHQLSTLPQKIDSRDGLLWCKKGVVCECGIMNIYLSRPSLTLILGLFAAKCSVFWCKMECVLVLNARWNGAKCSAKWCLTQGKRHKHTRQRYKYNPFEPWNTWLKRAK